MKRLDASGKLNLLMDRSIGDVLDLDYRLECEGRGTGGERGGECLAGDRRSAKRVDISFLKGSQVREKRPRMKLPISWSLCQRLRGAPLKRTTSEGGPVSGLMHWNSDALG